MTARRRICVVTSTRAEYGILFWLLTEIKSDPELQLQIIAAGAHLSPEFGSTFQEIERDGFHIDAKVETLLSSESAVGITKSMGLSLIGLADALSTLRPDILVLLGDRYELLAAAEAGMIARVPIAHIHGGEASEGAYDDSIRHAITKMADFHFTAAEPYRKRVVQLGESPERVYNYGSPGLDWLKNLEWLDRPSLEQLLGLPLGFPSFLITYHPVTLDYANGEPGMAALLDALDAFPRATVVFTYPNADAGGRSLIAMMEDWVGRNRHRAKAIISLGQRRYLSLMREVDVIIGNSSSGLTEAPALKKAFVNVGERQKGRLKASSVLDATGNKASIVEAIERALSPSFRDALEETKSLYGCGDASRRIKDTLKLVALEPRKVFFGIDHAH